MCQTTMSGGIDDMDEISSSTSSNKKVEKLIEPRKIRKPLMEKKRRARINQSLDELKRIVVDAQKIAGKDLSRVNKLEKADILEMTVRYLKRKATPHADVYAAGYRQCMEQVQELMAEQWTDERRQRSGRRMVEHLETCARRLQKTPPPPTPMDNCRLSSVSSANRFSAGQPCDAPARNSCSSSSSASCSSSDDDCCSVSESSSELHRLSPANAAADRTTELQNTAPLKPTWRPW